jgi:formate hydrogenlyase subunit 3/multisubunit Na+/H+ antiporter MnhD subunit
MEYWFIYLLQLMDTLEAINILCCLLFVLSGVALIIMGFLTRFTYEKFEPNYYDISKDTAICGSKIIKKTCIISVCLALILSFIPTKQTALMLGGVYLGKKAVNAVITDEKIKKIDTIINLELNKRIKELKAE